MEKHWLDYLSGIGAIATPVLVLFLTAMGWRLRQSFERKLHLENELREDRVDIYNNILEPFIIMLMTDAAWTHDEKNRTLDKGEVAMQLMLSLDYRKQAFKMSLLGSDDVVLAYNNLMQFFYSFEGNVESLEARSKEMMGLLGTFLLAIRRSMGNEFTTINNWQMLEWFMTDARKWRDS